MLMKRIFTDINKHKELKIALIHFYIRKKTKNSCYNLRLKKGKKNLKKT